MVQIIHIIPWGRLSQEQGWAGLGVNWFELYHILYLSTDRQGSRPYVIDYIVSSCLLTQYQPSGGNALVHFTFT